MVSRCPLSQAQKEQIYLGKLGGCSLSELAATVGCTVHCARKWWRIGRDTGLVGLRASRRGRGKAGTLSCFDPAIAATALALKRAHPGWGARRVLVELQAEGALCGRRLPGRSRLAVFFREQCPQCVATRRPRRRPPQPAAAPRQVHEQWQLDSQEGIRLTNQEVATICNIRDPVSGAMIASRAFAVGTKRRWRKLEWTEVREVVRAAFAEWQTLPDALQTDNELGLAGTSSDLFPGKLTLWLHGLGVSHRFIRPGRPTDQPHIERNHRALKNWAMDTQSLADLHHLQQALERERQVHNQLFPSQASDCAGRPPLTAHQELLIPRRLYQLDREQELFDPQRVYDFLAQFSFKRTVDGKARVSLGRQTYSLGQQHVRQHNLQSVLARFDPNAKEWVFLTPDEQEIMRRPPKGLDPQSLTGLNPSGTVPAHEVQLTLPFLVPPSGVRLLLDS
jgi:Integrase core domain